jgi:glutamyl-tRNA synthetase
MKDIRLRFAPSPTGYLHIGGLRTVLFSYLTAKSLGGKLILRIEDTDQKRKVEGSDKKLIEILKWCGIDFDEGAQIGGEYGPYVQSERRNIYDKQIQTLLDKGEAYHCFCSSEKLDKVRKEKQAKKLPPRYDRCCRDLSKDEVQKRIDDKEPYVIRQKMPLSGEVIAHDELRGDIKFQAEELEDHVLIKSDGMPTYQFANVVDDHLMEISHVTRAEEWIPSFPKNILLYKSFGWEAPKFIHFPVILSKTGGKLSKRQGDVAVEEFKSSGYIVPALINFNALLGWHPEGDNEIFSIDEAIKLFDYRKIGTSPAVFDVEKLDYFNGYYIRQMDAMELLEVAKPFLLENIKVSSNSKKGEEKFLLGVVRAEQERLKKLSDIAEATKFFFLDELDFDPMLLLWKKMIRSEAKENLGTIHSLLEKIPESNWTDDSIEDAIVTYLKAKELKVGTYLWPMRVALTGQKASPGPFQVAEVLGKKETLDRVDKSIKKL